MPNQDVHPHTPAPPVQLHPRRRLSTRHAGRLAAVQHTPPAPGWPRTARGYRLAAIGYLLLLCLLLPLPALAQTVIEPDDPNFADQWALEKVGAACAWQHTRGDAQITVAVIDTGVDMRHPDLRDRVRDDGYDFVDDDDNPRDEHGHGTHVAGIIAATLNNTEGGVGLAPDVSILPVRVLSYEGYGEDAWIADGIRFAADQGAQVINLSLGSTLLTQAQQSSSISEAIRYAQDVGALVVVAAGNDFVPLPNSIAADNADVLVVAATDENDIKTRFSNFGEWVDVSAPGQHILSTMPTYEVFLTSDALPREERFNRDYDYMSGTSQATPYVSALAALLLASNPDLSIDELIIQLTSTAYDIYPLHPPLAEGQLGSGRIDACAALGGPLVAVATGPLPGVPTSVLIIAAALLCLCLVIMIPLVFFGVRYLNRRSAAPAAIPPGAPVVPPPPPATPIQIPPPTPTPSPYTPPPATGVTLPHPPPAPPANAPWGALSIVGGPVPQRSFVLTGPEVLIGRADDCSVVLIGDGTVSRRHARLTFMAGQVLIADLGSSHGTFVNEQRVTDQIVLRYGDQIRVGQTVLKFGV